MRRTLVPVHVVVACVFLPIALMFASTGGLFPRAATAGQGQHGLAAPVQPHKAKGSEVAKAVCVDWTIALVPRLRMTRTPSRGVFAPDYRMRRRVVPSPAGTAVRQRTGRELPEA